MDSGRNLGPNNSSGMCLCPCGGGGGGGASLRNCQKGRVKGGEQGEKRGDCQE